MRSIVAISAILCLAPGCRQALGDPCDDSHACEVGLVCDEGRCLRPRPSPPLESIPLLEQVEIEGLTARVEVALDEWGTPHVYASSIEDAWTAAGFLMARDRAGQLELARRAALGQLAPAVEGDVADAASRDAMARLLGLESTAAAAWAETPPSSPDGRALTGFSRGVTSFFERARAGLEDVDEPTMELLDLAPRAWTPTDSLAVAQLELLRTTWIADRELELHLLLERSERMFQAESSDFDLAWRRGFGVDVVRLDPAVETAVAFEPGGATSPREPALPRPQIDPTGSSEGWLGALGLVRELSGASTARDVAWSSSGVMSRHGGGLLAAALDEPLGAPPLFYSLHLVVSDGSGTLGVAGLCRVGIPAVVSGFNGDVAWTRVPSGADLVDLFLEQVSPASGGAWTVRLGARDVAVEPVTVEVETASGPVILETGRVPHHGPFVPVVSDGQLLKGWDDVAGLTVRWTGTTPARTLGAASAVATTGSAREAAGVLDRWSEPSSLWLAVDRHGSTALVRPRCVPRRREACLPSSPVRESRCAPFTVLPGTGEAEWEDCDPAGPGGASVAFDEPAREFSIAAGADLTGATFDEDPFSGPEPYFGWSFEPGYRTARLEELLSAHGNRQRLSADDAMSTLTDVRSSLFSALLPALATAVERGRREREESGSELDLARLIDQMGSRFDRIEEAYEMLEAWDLTFPAGEDSGPAGAAAAVAGTWLPRFLGAVLGDELELLEVSLDDQIAIRALTLLLSEGELLMTRSLATGQSTIFDDLGTDSRFESRDERLLRSLDEAIQWLEDELGTEMSGWRWDDLHGVVLPGLAIAEGGWGTIGGEAGRLPLPGGPWSLWGCANALSSSDLGCDGSAPGARLAVEMAPSGPEGRVVLAGDQRGGPGADREVELWRRGQSRRLAFRLDEVLETAAARIRFEPSPASP
jgi:penicillin amidase